MSARKNETTRAWLVVALLMILPAMAAWGDDDDGYDDDGAGYSESTDQEDDSADRDYGGVSIPSYRGGYGYSYGSPPPVMVIRPESGVRVFGGTVFTPKATCFTGTAGTACY